MDEILEAVDPSSPSSSPLASFNDLSIDFSDPFGWILSLQVYLSFNHNICTLPPDTTPPLPISPFSASCVCLCRLTSLPILPFQCLVSLSLNLVVLAAFFRDRSLRFDGSTALLFNLVLADLGITICGCPFSATAAFYGRWPFGEIGCTLYGFQVSQSGFFKPSRLTAFYVIYVLV